MTRWDIMVERFSKQCESRGLSHFTIDARRRELYKWGYWIKTHYKKCKIDKISTESMMAYIKARSTFHSKGTLSSAMSDMRCFGKFLVAEGVWDKNPMRWIDGPKIHFRMRIPKRISKENIKEIFTVAAEVENDYFRHLWLAAIGTFYGTGIRRGEFCRLKLSDLDDGRRMLKVDGHKTGRERYVPIPEITWRLLSLYLPFRANLLLKLGVEDDGLFISRDGTRILGSQVWTGLKRIFRKAGVEGVTLHQFRHTCASDLLEEGVGVAAVQNILGHASLYSTFRYTHVADPERHKAIQKHPINSFLSQKGEQNVR